VVVVLVVEAVYDRCDAPDRLTISFGEEVRDLGMLVEGVLAAVQRGPDGYAERRHPVRVAGVDAPGELDERVERAACGDLPHPQARRRCGCGRPGAHRAGSGVRARRARRAPA